MLRTTSAERGLEQFRSMSDILITDSYSSSSNKMQKAKKMGITIKTYQDLLKELE
jgi:hypothetical protein